MCLSTTTFRSALLFGSNWEHISTNKNITQICSWFAKKKKTLGNAQRYFDCKLLKTFSGHFQCLTKRKSISSHKTSLTEKRNYWFGYSLVHYMWRILISEIISARFGLVVFNIVFRSKLICFHTWKWIKEPQGSRMHKIRLLMVWHRRGDHM